MEIPLKYGCDYCNRDLTYDEGCDSWRLELSSKKMDFAPGGFRYAIMTYSPIERTYHFCGLKCLKKWMESDGKKT